MANIQWDSIVPLDNHDTGQFSLGDYRRTNGTSLLQGYDFDNDKHFIAAIDDVPEGLDRKGLTGFLRDNAERLIKASSNVMDDLTDGATATINKAYDAFAEKIGGAKLMEATKVLEGAPDLSTTMHINKQTGAVISEAVMENSGTLKKIAGKFGVVGGAVAASMALATGASAAEVTAQAVPGGQSAMALSKGDKLEATFLAIEETGIGSILTEFARPVARGLGLGSNVQSGVLESAFTAAADWFKGEPEAAPSAPALASRQPSRGGNTFG